MNQCNINFTLFGFALSVKNARGTPRAIAK